jgi:hypothetical protein
MNKIQLYLYSKILLLFSNTILLLLYFLSSPINELSIIFIFACSFSYIFSICLNNKSSIATIILSIYHFIVGPLNLYFSINSPSYLITSTFNNFYGVWLFNETSIIFEYVFQLNTSIFLIMIILTLNFPKSFKIFASRILKFNYPRFLKIGKSLFLNFIWLLFISIFEYSLRITYRLNIPGSLPLIQGAGYIIYLFEGYKLYLISKILLLLINKFYNRFQFLFIFSLISIGIYSLPSLLIGQRALILNVILSLVLFYLLIFRNNLIVINLKLLRTKFILGSTFLFFFSTAFIVLGVTNYIRIGEFEVFSFLLRRITGLYDGLIFLHFSSNNKDLFQLDIFDFLQRLISDNLISPNKFYTINILGYPVTAVHGSAVPFYVSSLYYGGIFGLLSISLYFGMLIKIIFVFIDELLIEISLSYSKFKQKFIMLLFPALYFFGLIFWSNIIDGDITHWKLYSVPIICFGFIFITKVSD